MANSIKKLCIDSRFSAPGSKGNADFRYVLTESIHIPDNMAMYVTDVCIPRSWYTIEYFNENLYFRHFKPDNTFNDYRVQLPRRNYDINSLASAVALAMNQALGSVNAFSASANVTNTGMSKFV